jgi:hypothetical protein
MLGQFGSRNALAGSLGDSLDGNVIVWVIRAHRGGSSNVAFHPAPEPVVASTGFFLVDDVTGRQPKDAELPKALAAASPA